MIIRRAEEKDIDQILCLLSQTSIVHAASRPDLFVGGETKYTGEEIAEMLSDDDTIIFVAMEEEKMLGYVFCEIRKQPASNVAKDFTYLFIDDFCVDETVRKNHVGTKLFEYVKEYAKEQDFYEITLNVWEGNDVAKAFYEKLGMNIKKYNMELILDTMEE